MKIKKHYKNLFSSPYEPIIIQKLYSEISKLLSENLNLNLREAKLESRFILEQTLKVKHQYLIKNSNQLIETNKFKQIMSYVVQRLSYKPLAYIFKEWKFYDMKFFLTNNVLIPRQDTELVIDLILEKYHTSILV